MMPPINLCIVLILKWVHVLTKSYSFFSDSKVLVIMYLLHCVFIPSSKKSTRDENGKKGFTKYSIRDSQKLFVIVKPTTVDMESTLQKMSERGAIQPCVLVVGLLFDAKQILVYFDNIKYKMFSAIRALTYVLKSFMFST
jgi:hypothetical protein